MIAASVPAGYMGRKSSEFMESWLKCNRRAIYVGLLVPAFFLLIGGYLAIRGAATGASWIFVAFGVFLAVIGSWLSIALVRMLNTPRIGYDDGCLLVNLRSGEPIRIPVDIVECFFRGQGPSQVGTGPVEDAETSQVVVRLAEKAADWHHVETKLALGHWCEGYITVNGAWCEPIDRAVLERLNASLIRVKRDLRQQTLDHDKATQT